MIVSIQAIEKRARKHLEAQGHCLFWSPEKQQYMLFGTDHRVYGTADSPNALAVMLGVLRPNERIVPNARGAIERDAK